MFPMFRMVEKPLDELEQVLEDQKASKLAKKKGVLLRSKEEKRLQRRERERRRKNKHRNRRQEEEEGEKDFEQLADRVGFGEVVHAPPTLTFKAGLWCRGTILIRIRFFRSLLIGSILGHNKC
jgi:hypothetical protein